MNDFELAHGHTVQGFKMFDDLEVRRHGVACFNPRTLSLESSTCSLLRVQSRARVRRQQRQDIANKERIAMLKTHLQVDRPRPWCLHLTEQASDARPVATPLGRSTVSLPPGLW